MTRRRLSVRAAAALLLGLVGLSCTSQPTILPSRDFERPTDIAFVCMGAFDPNQPAAPSPADGGADQDASGEGGVPVEADAAPTTAAPVLSGRPMYLVRVWAPVEVLEQRERRREDRGSGIAREQATHPAFQRRYDLSIDTSKCSPEEAASEIRAFIKQGTAE